MNRGDIFHLHPLSSVGRLVQSPGAGQVACWKLPLSHMAA